MRVGMPADGGRGCGVTEIDRRYHDVANIFPLMSGEEFEALKADIAQHGLRESIWLHPDGSIIDGRNRHRACIETGTPPRFRKWDGNGSLVAFVVSMNLHRRHLTSGQRAMAAQDILPMLEAEAEGQRRKSIGETRSVIHDQMSQKIDSSSDDHAHKDANGNANFGNNGKSTEQAATLFGTNRQYVSDAKSIAQKAPDVAERVRSGEISIAQAKREITKRERIDTPPVPIAGKYRIWYADPPWEYGNSGVINESDNYGRAQRHYPTMSIEQLCGMGEQIKAACEKDAVLFLWVTSPLLEECFDVIRAWGFKYKTSFVWDKIRHNFGHYNSVRHELLLVCTKGSCTPDDKTLHDSVVSIERSDRHSEKPEIFRRTIDSLYTWGNRIELFARTSAPGWHRWGNEPEQHEAG